MTERRERRSNAGSKTVGRPHSIKSEEVTHWFQVWGIVGKSREPMKLVRLAHFDRGPGFKSKLPFGLGPEHYEGRN